MQIAISENGGIKMATVTVTIIFDSEVSAPDQTKCTILAAGMKTKLPTLGNSKRLISHFLLATYFALSYILYVHVASKQKLFGCSFSASILKWKKYGIL